MRKRFFATIVVARIPYSVIHNEKGEIVADVMLTEDKTRWLLTKPDGEIQSFPKSEFEALAGQFPGVVWGLNGAMIVMLQGLAG